jgi:D-alanyl-D-alanine dipeptidase
MPKSDFRASDLVELQLLDSTFKLDIRYATIHNFTRQKMYAQPRAFLQRPAAQALVRVNNVLRENNCGLIIFDGYRPWSVTKKFWDMTPGNSKQFVADPREGSHHNRGCAVDVSLYDLTTEKPLMMPCDFDDFTPKAHPAYAGGSAHARKNRDLLASVMGGEGFSIHPKEWWHYDYQDWWQYQILDIPFEKIRRNLPAQ